MQQRSNRQRSAATLVAVLACSGMGAACTAELGNKGKAGDTASTDGVNSGVDTGTNSGTNSGPSPFEPLGGIDPIACDPAAAGFDTPRIWRLTRRQYNATVAALLGDDTRPADEFLSEPGSEQGFQNNAYQLRVRLTEAGQFREAAKQLASNVVASHFDDIFPCTADQVADPTCQTNFIAEFGARVFRRPLTEDEIARYRELYQLGLEKGDGNLAVAVAVEAMLQSPYFLYRFELGDFDPAAPSTATLTPHEIATAISFYLTEGPPDVALVQAADSGELSAANVRMSQAQRLLAFSDGREAQLEFYRQLFEYSSLDNVVKDESVFADLRGEYHREMEEFVGYTLFEGGGTVEHLLTAEYTFVNQTLGDFLGLAASGDEFERVAVDPSQRAGILSLTGLNAVVSAQTRTSPVNRGRFVREKLLCDHINEPPEGVDINLPALDPGMTAREQLELKTSPPECSGCHSAMNPVGFGMETLDALGRYRTEENGLPIDASGDIIGTRDVDGPFLGVPELAHKLSESEQVKECFVIKHYRYAFGRGENSQDACTIAALRDAFLTGGADLSELPALIVATEQFVTRAPKN